MTPAERRDLIAEMVLSRERVSVEELAERLTISREIVRRDLSALDRTGAVRKVHGGAVSGRSVRPPPPDGHASAEGPFERRMTQNSGAKRAIGRAAAGLLRPGDSVFIDTGSTTLRFAEALVEVPGLTVITNSAAIASLAGRGDGARVYLIGGEYRRDGQESVGAMAVQQIGQLRAAHAFLTVGSVDARGVADFDLQEAQIARAMIERAEAVTVLADASKFEARAVFPVASLGALTRLVTDRLPGALRPALASADVRVVLASAAVAA